MRIGSFLVGAAFGILLAGIGMALYAHSSLAVPLGVFAAVFLGFLGAHTDG